MPAVSSDLKDLMCYQIHKFERTTGPLPLGELDMNQKYESNMDDRILYENLPLTSQSAQLCHHRNYSNLECECDAPGVVRCQSPNVKDRQVLTHHHSFHYCPEYESRVKRSRTILFGSGGDMTINKNHGYANATVVPNSPPVPLREKSSHPVTHRHSHHIDLSRDTPNNLRISLNLPAQFDLDSFLKTHSLSISINVSEKKKPNVSGGGSDLRSQIDELNRNLLSQSGWYYRNVDWQESRRILKSSPLGTFLVRDSSDPNYSFSLSVQTVKGPISSRIGFSSGKYRLDSQITDTDKMPAFSTVIALIQHYIKNGLVRSPSGRQVWIDSQGQICSQVQLTKPKLKEVGNLRHLCRLVLNQNPQQLQSKSSGNEINSKDLPLSIQSYLEDYPYPI